MLSGHSGLARPVAKLVLAALMLATAMIASHILPRPTPALAQALVDNRVFDGHWYSPEWRYGYILRDGVGVATSTNSPNFRVGDVIIRIYAVGPWTFVGEQVYRNGRWYRIRGRLASDGRIYIDGEKNVSWFMVRTD
jgi:hypothetical protein